MDARALSIVIPRQAPLPCSLCSRLQSVNVAVHQEPGDSMFATYRIVVDTADGLHPLIVESQGYGAQAAALRALDAHPGYTVATATHVESSRGDLRPLPSHVKVTR